MNIYHPNLFAVDIFMTTQSTHFLFYAPHNIVKYIKNKQYPMLIKCVNGIILIIDHYCPLSYIKISKSLHYIRQIPITNRVTSQDA
jgi:hypothetical protein